MNGRLILELSLFGLAMGIATVFVIPSAAEPLIWAAIFLVCAYVIARRGREAPFLNGVLLGLMNSVWVTGAHVLFFGQYLANHPAEAGMMKGLPLSPRLMMACVGPFIGLASGGVLGLFALVASKLRRTP